jgi:hypothetical protein
MMFTKVFTTNSLIHGTTPGFLVLQEGLPQQEKFWNKLFHDFFEQLGEHANVVVDGIRHAV